MPLLYFKVGINSDHMLMVFCTNQFIRLIDQTDLLYEFCQMKVSFWKYGLTLFKKSFLKFYTDDYIRIDC